MLPKTPWTRNRPETTRRARRIHLRRRSNRHSGFEIESTLGSVIEPPVTGSSNYSMEHSFDTPSEPRFTSPFDNIVGTGMGTAIGTPTGTDDDLDDFGPPDPIRLLPGEHTNKRRFYFALANGFTVTSIALALTAIFYATNGNIMAAALALVGCVIADGLDGPVARRNGVASPFGAQMDSLADMCAFGVATPVLMYTWMNGTLPTPVLLAIGIAFGACAAIRLARFNVSPKDGRYFSGVPTTLAAGVIGLSILVIAVPGREMAFLVAALAMFMVSPFPYPKLRQVAKLPVWLWILPLAAIFFDPELTFFGLAWGYLASGPLLWIGLRRNKDDAKM